MELPHASERIMDTLEFLQAVLPTPDNTLTRYDYYVYGGNKRLTQTVVRSLPEAVIEAQTRTGKNQNVYIGMGAFKENTNRKAVNVAAKQCFYIDLDCGPGKPYSVKSEALNALTEFLRQTKFLTPTLVVDSGRGLHAYWILQGSIPNAEWQLAANQLKLFLGGKLDTDSAVTADSARILRIPGTFNQKGDQPVPCKVIFNNKQKYTLTQFQNALPDHPGENIVALPSRSDRAPDGYVLGSADDLITEVPYQPRMFSNIVKQCGVAKMAVETAGEHADYNEWFNLINLLAFCEDGPTTAHLISYNHPDYNADETTEKFEQTLNDVATGQLTGATTCATFAGCAPELCLKCPHYQDPRRGQDWSSPIHFGVASATTEVSPADMPYGWRRSQFSGRWVIEHLKPGKGDDPDKWAAAIHGNIPEIQIIDSVDGSLINFVMERAGGKFDVNIPITALNLPPSGIHTELSTQRVVLQVEEIKHFGRLMVAWYNNVRSVKSTKPAIDQMGWMTHEGKGGFSVGTDIYWADGTEEKAYTPDKGVASIYEKAGTESAWRGLVDKALQAEHIETEVLFATAFASPLVHLSSERGCILSAISPESGTGKTLAMRMAQSVWGHPTKGMLSMDDTANMVAKRLTLTNSLPAYWDEVRIAREGGDAFVDFLYRTSMGKEKGRMKATTALQETKTWETLITCTSNASMHDQIAHSDTATNAGMLRVLEFTVSPLNRELMASPHSFATLDQNYGHAGRIFATNLAANREKIAAGLNALVEKLSTLLNVVPNERFLITTIATIMQGAGLAKAWGLVDFNLTGIRDFLIKTFKDIRRRATPIDAPLVADPLQAVQEYLTEMADHIYITDEFSCHGPILRHAKFAPVRGRVAVKEQVICLQAGMYRKWVQEKYRNSTHHYNILKENGAVFTNERITKFMGHGTGFAGVQRSIRIFRNPTTDFLFDGDEEST